MIVIKMVVFDLDGTLVNSLTDLALNVNKGLVRAGLPEKPIENYNQYVGNGREVMIKSAMGEFSSDETLLSKVRDTFNEEYAKHCCDNTNPYEGCRQLLKKLSEKKIMTAVLSNKPDEFVGKISETAFKNHCFTEAWGQKPQYKRKPSGEALVAMLEKYSVKKEECMYVGDSDVDVFTAKNAGVNMAGVAWGFRGKEELLGAGAPFVAENAEQLYEYIVKFGSENEQG